MGEEKRINMTAAGRRDRSMLNPNRDSISKFEFIRATGDGPNSCLLSPEISKYASVMLHRNSL